MIRLFKHTVFQIIRIETQILQRQLQETTLCTILENDGLRFFKRCTACDSCNYHIFIQLLLSSLFRIISCSSKLHETTAPPTEHLGKKSKQGSISAFFPFGKRLLLDLFALSTSSSEGQISTVSSHGRGTHRYCHFPSKQIKCPHIAILNPLLLQHCRCT